MADYNLWECGWCKKINHWGSQCVSGCGRFGTDDKRLWQCSGCDAINLWSRWNCIGCGERYVAPSR